MKKLSALCLFLLLMLSACSSQTLEQSMKKAQSTNLSGESIGGLKVGTFLQEDSGFKVYESNGEYDRNYNQFRNGKLDVSVDKETDEILAVGVIEGGTGSTTAHIGLGSSLDEVTAAYGENYFSYTDSNQGMQEIGYVDHENNLLLSFVHVENKVTGMSLGYAFDRLIWE
ncbi:hypothetical protein [Rossellomorea marisflavi]|uniref:hypothetical protein n=1 Tax=Rossellomorea marisflavi TaxID=189381 RepID=UPI00064FA95B|nr:hypothetical protein [Rossellomorea marisflavi]KMK95244.1 hypothetical protein VL03_10855 [Rossellomorea marisflavi]KML31269.1 hypothetical protein VL12_18170 [Rossellomorea marisflavi]